MAKRLLTERAADLGNFASIKTAGQRLPFAPEVIAHVYIKLQFTEESENAKSAEVAKGFLRSVARAAEAAGHLARIYNGVLLELQGSLLHVGLQKPAIGSLMDSVNSYVADLHWSLNILFSDRQKRVRGWRMTADIGKTLIVAGRGVHGDDSYVSLGNAANRPAKHLFAQLELPEAIRDLKNFHVGVRQPSGRWLHENLERSHPRLRKEAQEIAELASRAVPRIRFDQGFFGMKQAFAKAAPLSPAGSPAAPTPEEPHTYFGWVMRTDLDGFTARVEACLDRDERLQELAADFYFLMDSATDFTLNHKEELAQLPWAGDNYTAAAVFSTKAEYELAIPKRLVELALDFEKEMGQAARDCGTGGWAYGIAGGEVHGNAGGNVYLAGIEVHNQRFLVGVGEGYGRSQRAYGDIDPKAKQVVLYKPDWVKLEQRYKDAFEPAVTVRNETSSLYRISSTDGLMRVRGEQASAVAFATLELTGRPTITIPAKPHYK